LDQARPIVLIAEPGRELEAATRLGRIGFDNVAGYLGGAMEALEGERPELLERTERITAASLAEQLESPEAPVVIDVRAPGEWEERRIEGSINVPLSRLSDELDGLPEGRALVVYCSSGYRSAIAASMLRHRGVDRVHDLVGGLAAWSALAV
jgi:rhodanese-related sulfurtransferase